MCIFIVVKIHARFRIPIKGVKVCVAANGAVFLMRSLGCAFFIIRGDVMKKIFCFACAVVFCLIFCACSYPVSPQDNDIDNSVLDEVQPKDDFSKLLTKEFIEEYEKTEYSKTYNSNTDKIIIHYIGVVPAYPDEEQYAINYYSVRNIDSIEAGYIAACLEETAWKLWGCFRTGVKPIVFSGYKYYKNTATHTCLYSFGYTNNVTSDEYGDSYPCNKFRKQLFEDISVTAGHSIWEELGAKTKVEKWQQNEKGVVFENYLKAREVLNNDINNQPQVPLIDSNASFALFKNGTWWDEWSQRCHLEMEVIGNDTVQITIEWSGGADNTTLWHITGKWDNETHCLYYENCIMTEVETVDWSEDSVIVGEYTDGTGYFYFNNGYLYWVDYKENAGKDCYFEFAYCE